MMKALRFEGSGFEYFKIWIVNILLTIVTLGLYYPWAKVRNRRYFCANSMLEDRNFEYHASGKQLFLGYLIAMGLLIAYIVLQNVSPALSGIALIILFFGLPWVIWRSLKFNMRMTSFSNVRFGFENGLGGAYVNYLLLPILLFAVIYGIPIAAFIFSMQTVGAMAATPILFIGLIVGLILALFVFAFMKKRNTSYAINGYRYGQGIFYTDVKTKAFLWIILKCIGISIMATVGILILMAVLASVSGLAGSLLELDLNIGDPESMQSVFQNSAIVAVIGLVYLGLILISMLVLAYFVTRTREYIYENSSLDKQITFFSSLKTLPFAWVMISNLLLIIFTLGLGLPWAKVRMARLFLENTHVDTSVGIDNYLTQRQGEQSSLGEQIGDAFDVDVGIGF